MLTNSKTKRNKPALTNKYHEAAIEVMDNYFPEIEFDVVLGIEKAILNQILLF